MTANPRSSQPADRSSGRPVALLVFSWLFVGVPLAWGVTQTIMKSMALFH